MLNSSCLLRTGRVLSIAYFLADFKFVVYAVQCRETRAVSLDRTVHLSPSSRPSALSSHRQHCCGVLRLEALQDQFFKNRFFTITVNEHR